MRTVHETEALRPSDPVPRSYTSAHFKPQRLKLVMKPPKSERDHTREDREDDDATVSTNSDPENEVTTKASTRNGRSTGAEGPTGMKSRGEVAVENNQSRHPTAMASTFINSTISSSGRKAPPLDSTTTNNNNTTTNPYDPTWPSDLALSPEEQALPLDALFKLTRRQLHWTEQENASLRSECADLEHKRKEEWLSKELLMLNVMEADLALAQVKGDLEKPLMDKVLLDMPYPPLRMKGSMPWYREPAASTTIADDENGNGNMDGDEGIIASAAKNGLNGKAGEAEIEAEIKGE